MSVDRPSKRLAQQGVRKHLDSALDYLDGPEYDSLLAPGDELPVRTSNEKFTIFCRVVRNLDGPVPDGMEHVQQPLPFKDPVSENGRIPHPKAALTPKEEALKKIKKPHRALEEAATDQLVTGVELFRAANLRVHGDKLHSGQRQMLCDLVRAEILERTSRDQYRLHPSHPRSRRGGKPNPPSVA